MDERPELTIGGLVLILALACLIACAVLFGAPELLAPFRSRPATP